MAAGDCPHPLACTSSGDPGPVAAGREAACTCGHTRSTRWFSLRRVHATQHPEELLTCKRVFLMAEHLLDTVEGSHVSRLAGFSAQLFPDSVFTSL